jgi:ligand-binding sensor domain-containing protein
MTLARTWFLLFVGMFLLFAGCESPDDTPPVVGPVWTRFTRASTGGGLVNDRINYIYIDASGKTWFATDGGAASLCRSRWNSFTTDLQYYNYSNGGSTISRKVNCIAEGVNNSLWFGLAGGGIRKYLAVGAQQPWTTYTTSDGLSSDVITGMSSDRFRDVWCATTYGVSSFKPSSDNPTEGTWTRFDQQNSQLPSMFISSVKVNNSTNLIWFGSYYGDLVSYDGSVVWTPYVAPEGASPIKAMAHDGDNTIWVATDNGVYSFSSTGGWNKYSVATTGGGLPSDFVRCVAVDISGGKWFGTELGLARFKGGTWTVFNRATVPELPSDTITALAVDFKKNVWIGTLKGAAVYNENGYND